MRKLSNRLLDSCFMPLQVRMAQASNYGVCYKRTSNEPEYFSMTEPLNQILFGPPGTGKTYATIVKALAILEPDFNGSREELKDKFNEYVEAGQVKFVTFHQSFSYEDFVEGIRAEADPENKNLDYKVGDGVFKQICNFSGRKNIDLDGKTIWKIALGRGVGNEIYRDCIENNRALISCVGDIDFTGVSSRDEISDVINKNGREEGRSGHRDSRR